MKLQYILCTYMLSGFVWMCFTLPPLKTCHFVLLQRAKERPEFVQVSTKRWSWSLILLTSTPASRISFIFG